MNPDLQLFPRIASLEVDLKKNEFKYQEKMKRKSIKLLTIALLFGFMAFQAKAQIQTPRPSPMVKIEQEFGLGKITLDYSRPSVKGRTVFGELVPYDAVWRTGANGATTITFTDDVKVEGTAVSAGTYALYTIPGKTSWSVMLYKDLSLGGNTAGYNKENEIARFTVKPQELPFSVETMTMEIGNLKDASATLMIYWDKVLVGVNITTDVDAKVMAAIDAAMGGPSGGEYWAAANYYYANDKDINKALEWVNKAIEMNGNAPYWMLTAQARIMKKAGKKADALKVAKVALEKAEAAKNQNYIDENKAMIKELSK